MNPKRFLGANTELALKLFSQIEGQPLVCPHGHVDPELLANPEARFPDPVELFLRPDHYLLRMLYSQGIPMETFRDPEADPRELWGIFADNYRLFWGTPSGLWFDHQLRYVFGVEETLTPESANRIYELLSERLSQPEFTPRALYKKFGIEVLCTTDAATDELRAHRAVREEGWSGRMLPTFRPDQLLWAKHPQWGQQLERLAELESIEIGGLTEFLEALRGRRQFFRELGCTATDHGCESPYTEKISQEKAGDLFQKALLGTIDKFEATRLQGHLLMEMAAMSCEDGLVMQLHPGSFRNHNQGLFDKFGPDQGADIPLQTEFTRSLEPLLNRYGSHPNFRLILFTLDEATYSRELAPLAGHYPCLLLGPPWWFHDSPNGMLRYFEQVMETAGVFNTAGFNDDTRAFCSIPARHDLWRRLCCRWLADMVHDGRLSEEQAVELATELAVGRARSAYRLD